MSHWVQVRGRQTQTGTHPCACVMWIYASTCLPTATRVTEYQSMVTVAGGSFLDVVYTCRRRR
jgi:hypothetical protein